MSAWTVIGHRELTGSQASIEFTSIPATYTDLVVVCSLRATSAGESTGLVLKFNGSSSSYTARRLYAFQTSTPASDTNTSQFIVTASGATASTFSNVGIYIPNYAGSTNKSASFDGVGEHNGSNVYIGIGAFLWSVTDPITSIALSPEAAGASLVQYSSATLYGVLKGSSGGVTVS